MDVHINRIGRHLVHRFLLVLTAPSFLLWFCCGADSTFVWNKFSLDRVENALTMLTYSLTKSELVFFIAIFTRSPPLFSLVFANELFDFQIFLVLLLTHFLEHLIRFGAIDLLDLIFELLDLLLLLSFDRVNLLSCTFPSKFNRHLLELLLSL